MKFVKTIWKGGSQIRSQEVLIANQRQPLSATWGISGEAGLVQLSYPSSAAAVVFGVHLSAQAVFRLNPDTSGQSTTLHTAIR